MEDNFLVYLMIWVVLSVIVGIISTDKKMGFIGGFMLSLILSPLIGFIITLFSKSLEQEKREQELLETQKEQTRLLAEKSDNSISIADELEKLATLKDKGIITESEFQLGKEKLLNTK